MEANGRARVMDMWTSSYLSPVLDANQDLINPKASVEDGIITMEFSRKRNTSDINKDVVFTDDQGLFMIFPVKGGDFNGANKKIRKHEQTPTPSAQRIFIKACRNGKLLLVIRLLKTHVIFNDNCKFQTMERLRLPQHPDQPN